MYLRIFKEKNTYWIIFWCYMCKCMYVNKCFGSDFSDQKEISAVNCFLLYPWICLQCLYYIYAYLLTNVYFVLFVNQFSMSTLSIVYMIKGTVSANQQTLKLKAQIFPRYGSVTRNLPKISLGLMASLIQCNVMLLGCPIILVSKFPILYCFPTDNPKVISCPRNNKSFPHALTLLL